MISIEKKRIAIVVAALSAVSAGAFAAGCQARHPQGAAIRSGAGDAGLPVIEFSFPGPIRDKLVAAILSGEKTSTTELYEEHRRKGTPIDQVGSRGLLVDSHGRGVAVIETTEVAIKPMGEVDLAFAIDEGEGFKTVEEWKAAHHAFFTSPEMRNYLGEPPVTVDDRTLVVCYRFRVAERMGR